jgi:hypothetical protein
MRERKVLKWFEWNAISAVTSQNRSIPQQDVMW